MIWDDIADAYLAVSEDRDKILLPLLIRIVQDSDSKTIVDVGGGDGRFLELLWTQFGPTRFTAMALTDPSIRMRLRAKERLTRIGAVDIKPDPSDLARGSWQLALMIAVWMTLETEDRCVSVLRSVHSLLAPAGRLVAAVTHPCFRDRTFHSYSSTFDMCAYFMSGRRFKVNLYDSARSLTITDTHWSLADHARQLRAADFLIEDLIELPDVQSQAEGSPWLVIVARPV